MAMKEQIEQEIDLWVVVDENIICGTIGVIPVGDDSLLIMVNSVMEGPMKFFVVTANETFSDTVSRTLTFIDENSSLSPE